MNNEPSRPKKRHVLGRLIALLIVIGLAGGAFLYGSVAYDMVRASQFAPSSQVTGVVGRISFTPRGQQIFYATHPAIQEKSQFNESCKSTERTAAILGCYYKDRIYLYNIQNSELDGALEVTAAHETMHAAYHRLNYFERQRVDEMIRSVYEQIKNTPEIKQLMEYYAHAQPGTELDELHSIIGTTIPDLPADLERYYARYFSNRQVVVQLNANYVAVFSKLSAEADALQKVIDEEGPAIKAAMAEYEVNLGQLNSDIQNFNTRAESGAFRTQGEFNVARNALMARVSELSKQQAALNARVDTYNETISRLNALAVHANRLNESLNGVEAPEGV